MPGKSDQRIHAGSISYSGTDASYDLANGLGPASLPLSGDATVLLASLL